MKKTEIVICLGSSCFSRGNKMTIKVIQDYLTENNLKDKIYFHGAHCLGKCDKGPLLQIGGKTYENITSDNVVHLLNSIFGEK
ncbi:MAG: (2Fe-2S) ferredoxin domain-containing protein [Bacteroidia bacterium]|nr:NAD(P)H-dependent oxidoreductase subunit E [Bacteroidales bacterium]NCD41231.1 (2Fe-2S) ferredoxin domain-containing protein [Bacteroidia bacterium]MDD3011072.1 NAD(P)H-dependent oxidoreductase subunit E [Bacteroidales bacterium]MDD3960876.1 NAD(P)H-dependent oxidoreductase subunit E [Bacteroidales bacterium]MDY0285895.1 NAD(P)H-dependent oxidoreductase subunit E [Bacteroidales bacterium]